MRRQLVDAVTAETQADILRLHAELRDISASAPQVLAAFKDAADAISRERVDARAETQAAHQALAVFVSKRNADLLADLGGRVDQVQRLVVEHGAGAQATIQHLDQRLQRLTWIAGFSVALNVLMALVVALAFVLR